MNILQLLYTIYKDSARMKKSPAKQDFSSRNHYVYTALVTLPDLKQRVQTLI